MKASRLELLRDPIVLFAFVLIIAGADLILLATKLPLLIGLLPLVAGIMILIWRLDLLKKVLQWMERGEEIERKKPIREEAFAIRWINRISQNGKYLFLFIPFGAIILLGLFWYNYRVSINPEIGSYDILTIVMGCYFIIYPAIRNRFMRESDFIMIFFLLIGVLLLLPTLLFQEQVDTSSGIAESKVTRYFLVVPLSAVMTLLGISHETGVADIFFYTIDGEPASVRIAVSCTGIYSFLIFLSAFIAFILTEYRYLTRKVAVLAIIGVAFTYLANLLRMTLIILAGYFNGTGPEDKPFTLLWTHRYIGEVIFICWIALFWWIAFKYFAPRDLSARKIESKQEEIDEELEYDLVESENFRAKDL